MEFQESYDGLEMPFAPEVNYMTPVESRSETYVQKGPMVNAYRGELFYEEEERSKLRRNRNKVAASKCRKKRKEHLNNLAQMSDELEGENINLQSQIGQLQAELKKLEGMLDSHICSNTGTTHHSE